MKRTMAIVTLALLALFALALFSTIFSAPRMLDSYAAIETARAHQAAADAMQTQATATIFAISGMLCLGAVIGVLLVGGLGLATVQWLNYGRNDLTHKPALSHPNHPLTTHLRPFVPPNYQPTTQPTAWTPVDGFDWQSWGWTGDDFPDY